MKKCLSFLIVLVLSIPLTSFASKEPYQYGIFLGYRGYEFEEKTFSHNTHPDDYFLPNASTPGSAGKTKLGGCIVSYFTFGFRRQITIIENGLINIDLGVLGGGQEDKRVNANENRYYSGISCVFSDSKGGVYTGLGLSYHFWNMYIGGEAELAGIYERHGWYRGGSYDSESSSLEWYPSFGPKIGIQFDPNFGIEAGYLFDETPTYSITLIFSF